MDVEAFVRICKSSNLYNENFSEVDAERLFGRVVPKCRRSMTVEEFEVAVDRIVGMRLGSFSALARSYAGMVSKGDLVFTTARRCDTPSSSSSSLLSPLQSPAHSGARSPSQPSSRGSRSSEVLPPLLSQTQSRHRSTSTGSTPKSPQRSTSTGSIGSTSHSRRSTSTGSTRSLSSLTPLPSRVARPTFRSCRSGAVLVQGVNHPLGYGF